MRCGPLAAAEFLLSLENMSGAKRSGAEKGSLMAETAVTIESDPRKLEPGVVRMLVGLVIATGVIGALVLLS